MIDLFQRDGIEIEIEIMDYGALHLQFRPYYYFIEKGHV
jgi:hypothetical protein